MKKLTITIAQLAILIKVQEEITFQFDEVDKFIKQNKGKAELPELEIDEHEHADLLDSIKQFAEKLEEGDEKAEVTKWLEELTAEPVAEKGIATADSVAENVAANTAEEPGAQQIEPDAEETGKKE
ncbi:MAG: hypothetical protein WCL18_00520 [bacterium]